jgi:hypothetical protein
MTRITGTGNYLVTVTRTDGTKDQHRDTSIQEAIASARTWSCKDYVASADVHRTERQPNGRRVVVGHVGHYEGNRHLVAVQ